MTPCHDIAALRELYDIVVIGAGPAGMQAAMTASRHGRSVLVVDENATPGGQIYRAITTTPVRDPAVLGDAYWRGAALCRDFAATDIDYVSGAMVWSIGEPGAGPEPTVEIGIAMPKGARLVAARHVILATGAMERPFAVPGWTLPGVMTAGAAQIALKSAGLVPQGRTVLAGSGPLLYLLAAQLRAAGTDLVAILDTTPRANRMAALRHLPGFLASPYLAKGVKLLRQASRGANVLKGITALRIEGEARASRIVLSQGTAERSIACDLVLLHHGVIPNINMANAIGCAQRFDEGQHCWVPVVDEWFASSLAHVSIAGDAAGIGGAEHAAPSGALAALQAVHRLGGIDQARRDAAASPLRQEIVRTQRGRRFLDALYLPSRAFLAPRDPQTIACRCEEVTAGQIRDTVSRLNVLGPNQLKAFLRCGMGPCQGRLCGATVTELMAETRGVAMAEIGTYRLRPPFKPITVSQLMSMPKTEAAVKAVVRG